MGLNKYNTWRILPVKCYIDNSVCLQSCIINTNKHFWHRCQGSQLSLSVYRLSMIVLVSTIILTELSFVLFLFMVFIGKCMTEFNLPVNYHTDRESLLRNPRSRLSSPRSSGSLTQEIIDQLQGQTTPVELVPISTATCKCINDFSAPSSANIKTGQMTNVRDSHFELKPRLINMVQQSPFCGKALEDSNAHVQHFMEICSTFTIRGVDQDVVLCK
jgi:hypothetical protein